MLIEATTQTTQGHVYILSGNDDLNIAAGVTITSTATDAVTTWIGQHTVTVSGSVFSHDDCLNFIGTLEAQTVVIQASGRLTSGYTPGIEDADGVILDGIGSSLTNHGIITSHGSALSLFVHDGGTTTILNTGMMSGEKYGIWNKFGAGTLNFTNTGTIESPTTSYLGGIYVDLLTNSGTMHGAVDLSGGNDVYIGTGGRVFGLISGGAGDDRFVAGSFVDQINGGDGIDTLDFSALVTAITVDLANNLNNRGAEALGDSYSNIENVTAGSRNDKLTGNAANNTLKGGAGADQLKGGAGDDMLFGGIGQDGLTGGSGSDTFVFDTISGGKDVIFDFELAFDKIQLEGSIFGYGTYAGPLNAADFVVGTGNRALDATDRFIFRTTDATLWYDRDGTGAKLSVMVADLNNGIILSLTHLEMI
jgi:Ca2+-binding RTX toxin-like protein